MYEVKINKDTITAALNRALTRQDDLSDLMQDLGGLMVVRTQDRMTQGKDADGQPFAPRSAATEKRYKKLGLKFGVPLDQSGELRKSIAYDAAKDQVSWGSNQIQAAVMQFGAEAGAFGARIGKNKLGRSFFMPIPWGNIPARPYLGVGSEDSEAIVEEIEDWLADSFEAKD